MRPWTNIWINTRETIDQFKDSNWVQRYGLLVYFIVGINVTVESKIPLLIGSSKGSYFLVLLMVGLIFGIVTRLFWVNLIFYFGKIWKGQGTKRNIDTVLALCLIPEIFRLISIAPILILEEDLNSVNINYSVTLICSLLSFRILIIGLSTVQKFSYGISLVNTFVPPLTVWVLFQTIRGL